MVFVALAPACDAAPAREPIPNPPPAAVASPPKSADLDDDEAAGRYLEIKASLEADPGIVKGAQFPQLRADLEGIANGAGAPMLRANAAVLLGTMFEERGDPRKASGYYQHAATLVPDDAGPHMVSALALARAKDFVGAVASQQKAATLDPDNLENWLALGELKMRAGDEPGSAAAYVAYEVRRKGLIDGLTLHRDGEYLVGVDERVGCAEALAAAADQGTAVALIYALRTDPDATVRATVAGVMGLHRLTSYLPVLQTQVAEEADAAAKESVQWALAEIARAPVTLEATERPRLAVDDPRANDGQVPRAEAAPVAPTKDSTAAAPGVAPPATPDVGAGAPDAAKDGSAGGPDAAPGSPAKDGSKAAVPTTPAKEGPAAPGATPSPAPE